MKQSSREIVGMINIPEREEQVRGGRREGSKEGRTQERKGRKEEKDGGETKREE